MMSWKNYSHDLLIPVCLYKSIKSGALIVTRNKVDLLLGMKQWTWAEVVPGVARPIGGSVGLQSGGIYA